VGIGFREFLILAFVFALYLVVALIRACINTTARERRQAAVRREGFAPEDRGR
jgi:hypothetical protein